MHVDSKLCVIVQEYTFFRLGIHQRTNPTPRYRHFFRTLAAKSMTLLVFLVFWKVKSSKKGYVMTHTSKKLKPFV